MIVTRHDSCVERVPRRSRRMKAIAALSTLVGAVAMARAVASTSTARAELSSLGVLLSGLAGGLSHPFLDGIMHPDVHPFMP